jgi:hypothetical protein
MAFPELGCGGSLHTDYHGPLTCDWICRVYALRPNLRPLLITLGGAYKQHPVPDVAHTTTLSQRITSCIPEDVCGWYPLPSSTQDGPHSAAGRQLRRASVRRDSSGEVIGSASQKGITVGGVESSHKHSYQIHTRHHEFDSGPRQVSNMHGLGLRTYRSSIESIELLINGLPPKSLLLHTRSYTHARSSHANSSSSRALTCP